MRLLEEYYAAVGKVIEHFEATLTQFSGDGMMVLVNAPVACPDDPVIRATQLSLAMQASVQTLIVGWRQHGHTLGFGIGFAVGEATVGRIGYEGRDDYTAIGSVVNLASRLCDVALDGQVLLDANTAIGLSDEFALDVLGDRELKGLGDKTVVYAVSPKAAT